VHEIRLKVSADNRTASGLLFAPDAKNPAENSGANKKDFQNWRWLRGTICRTYTSHRCLASRTIPHLPDKPARHPRDRPNFVRKRL